jgi:hypothetical protein
LNARAVNRISLLLALVAALLISRMCLLLFAARPDNPGVELILWVSTPLYWPWQWIDAGQPLYGARFERGALVGVALCWCAQWGLRRWWQRRSPQQTDQP